MAETEPLKNGDNISSDKFKVSKFNVNFGQPFGESETDKILISQVARTKKIVDPFKARAEGDEYGVYMGRRRFLALKATGIKHFRVGHDVLIVNLNEEQARQDSLIENLKVLRTGMNPITRAQQLNELVSSSPDGLRGTARRLGLSPSTLSEWLKILELTKPMQKAVADGLLYYTDGLKLTKMQLGEIGESTLARTLESQGYEEFKKELERTTKKQLKRGIPAGKYFIERITFDKYYPPDMKSYGKLQQLAKQKNMEINEYIKKEVIEPHLRRSAPEQTSAASPSTTT